MPPGLVPGFFCLCLSDQMTDEGGAGDQSWAGALHEIRRNEVNLPIDDGGQLWPLLPCGFPVVAFVRVATDENHIRASGQNGFDADGHGRQ